MAIRKKPDPTIKLEPKDSKPFSKKDLINSIIKRKQKNNWEFFFLLFAQSYCYFIGRFFESFLERERERKKKNKKKITKNSFFVFFIFKYQYILNYPISE